MSHDAGTERERFKIIPEVFLFPIREGQILLSRRFQTGHEDGNYGLVAGHVEGGETMRHAIIREAFEEAGMILKPENLHFAVTLHRFCGDHERVGFYFVSSLWDGEITNKEPDKCDDLSWFPLSDLPQNTISYIRKALEIYQSHEHYGEWGWGDKSLISNNLNKEKLR